MISKARFGTAYWSCLRSMFTTEEDVMSLLRLDAGIHPCNRSFLVAWVNMQKSLDPCSLHMLLTTLHQLNVRGSADQHRTLTVTTHSNGTSELFGEVQSDGHRV
eukprot:2227595-Amphidinium_carterae.2